MLDVFFVAMEIKLYNIYRCRKNHLIKKRKHTFLVSIWLEILCTHDIYYDIMKFKRLTAILHLILKRETIVHSSARKRFLRWSDLQIKTSTLLLLWDRNDF